MNWQIARKKNLPSVWVKLNVRFKEMAYTLKANSNPINAGVRMLTSKPSHTRQTLFFIVLFTMAGRYLVWQSYIISRGNSKRSSYHKRWNLWKREALTLKRFKAYFIYISADTFLLEEHTSSFAYCVDFLRLALVIDEKSACSLQLIRMWVQIHSLLVLGKVFFFFGVLIYFLFFGIYFLE